MCLDKDLDNQFVFHLIKKLRQSVSCKIYENCCKYENGCSFDDKRRNFQRNPISLIIPSPIIEFREIVPHSRNNEKIFLLIYLYKRTL